MNKDEIKRKIDVALDLRKKQEFDRETRVREAWDNLTPFVNTWDVPRIPIVPKEEYLRFYVPRLIKAGAMPKKDLVDGQVYIGDHRRCKIARWNKALNKFEYVRHKMGGTFMDTCNHFEDDDGYALFVPIALGKQEDFEIL